MKAFSENVFVTGLVSLILVVMAAGRSWSQSRETGLNMQQMAKAWLALV